MEGRGRLLMSRGAGEIWVNPTEGYYYTTRKQEQQRQLQEYTLAALFGLLEIIQCTCRLVEKKRTQRREKRDAQGM